jgi:predicted amidohydrolase YtcJ
MRSVRGRYVRAALGAVLALVLLPFAVRSATQRVGGGGGGAGGDKPFPMVIRAARVIDGRGKIMTNVLVTVQGSKIVAIGKATKTTPPAMFNLGDVTLMPGMIDVHVHMALRAGRQVRHESSGPGGGDTGATCRRHSEEPRRHAAGGLHDDSDARQWRRQGIA